MAVLLAIVLVTNAWAGSVMYRPKREWRTINTESYVINVQKNGQTDILLPSEEPVFQNAYPMVWFDGEKEPEPLSIDGRSTARDAINDPLGRGQGMVFLKKNCEWRIHGYPAQPYLSVQVVFINDTKKPVKIKMLSPWAVGAPEKGGFTLGTGTARSAILDNGSLSDLEPRLTHLDKGRCVSTWDMAIYNPQTQRSLVAGFLTNLRCYTQIRLERKEASPDNVFDVLRAECVYDPPIEVAPNARFESEVLYLSVAASTPFEALEIFGYSVAAFNKRKPTRFALPHGWDSWSTKCRSDISEEKLIPALNFMVKNLKRYGWTHFSIDDGWQQATGAWEAAPERFPHGMKWLADQIHARGMTAGIWTEPFTVSLDTQLAKEHPEWLREPNLIGSSMLGGDERILDITAPGAYDHIKALYKKIGAEWGYDALVEADFVYHLLMAQSYAKPNLTRMEALRMGMSAIREGFGPDGFVMTMAPLFINSAYSDGMRIGSDCAPIWRKAPDKWPWGCVETLNNAAHRYYFTPHLWSTDQDCVFFGLPETRERWGVTELPELTWEQSIAWLTGAALTGGVVKIGDYLPDLDERQTAALTRILPTMNRPARPIDLFEREQPRIWSLPVTSPIGDWHIVAVFNWDENNAETTPLLFTQLGLAPGVQYTVYDFWQDAFYGLAQDHLDVTTAPSGVHLLGLRRCEDHPMFLATDRHFSQGATDFTALDWNGQARQLTATFNAIENTVYNLRVLVPESYTVQSVTTSAGEPKTQQDDRVLKINFHVANQGPVHWSVQF